MFTFILIGLITAGAAVVQVLSFIRLRNYVLAALKGGSADYRPRLAVILPCKGIDPGFQDNVKKLMEQDYCVAGADGGSTPNFEVFFSVACESDPAYPVLKHIAEAGGGPKATVVVAGTNPARGQKVNNQLAALKLVPPAAEVLVFVDSDVIARPDFLAHLVAGLADPAVGATTGYRFYVPYKLNFASLIRSLWNRMTAWQIVSPRLSFAWGGAMAIRLSTFQAAMVAESWDRAADDDLSLTTAVKKLGLAVRFVPQCLVASHGDTDIAECFEWMNRQLILTKVYYRQLWMRAIARALLMTVWLVLMLAAAARAATSSDPALLAALSVGLALIPVEIALLFAAQGLWQRVLSDQEGRLDTSFAAFCLAVPAAHLVLPFMTLYSILTNRIQWRGVTYELRSPTETVIV